MQNFRTGLMGPVALCLIWLSGCASFSGAPSRPEQSPGLETLDKAYGDTLTAYYTAIAPQTRQQVRNKFMETRAGVIDRQYAEFRGSLYAQRVGTAVGVDMATLGLNIAGVLATGERTKTAMNALSGGLIGGKASIDKNVYFDRTLPAMLSQMEGQRNTVRLRMLAGMDESTERYPLMQAAADLEEYFTAGTLGGAVSAITQQASVAEATSTAKLAARLPNESEVTTKLKAQGFQVDRAGEEDLASRQLMACIRPKGVINQPNQDALVAWAKLRKIDVAPPFGLTNFLTSKSTARARVQAVKDSALMKSFTNCD
ncbi:hypothetical protein ACSFBX_10270 [Variovorax sp. RB2P76]